MLCSSLCSCVPDIDLSGYSPCNAPCNVPDIDQSGYSQSCCVPDVEDVSGYSPSYVLNVDLSDYNQSCVPDLGPGGYSQSRTGPGDKPAGDSGVISSGKSDTVIHSLLVSTHTHTHTHTHTSVGSLTLSYIAYL